MPASNGDPEVDAGGVVAGFFAFTEITEPSAHRAYNEWHQLDHLPEQLPIPGISHGQRWVSTPRCREVSHWSVLDAGGSADLSAAQYLTLYLMREPLDETLALFYDLAVRLHDEDRFFPSRRALESGPLPVRATAAAPRVRVSAAAVPYRPNRGIYALVDNPTRDSDGRQTSTLSKSADDLLQIDGVAGVWLFGPGDSRPQDDRSQRDTGSTPLGTGAPLEAVVTI